MQCPPRKQWRGLWERLNIHHIGERYLTNKERFMTEQGEFSQYPDETVADPP